MNYSIGETIKELRKEAGLNKTQLASAIGVDRTMIKKWEDDGGDIMGANIRKLALFFNVTTDYLLGLSDKK